MIANRHKVVVFIRSGVLPMELGLTHQIFGQARSKEGEPLYEVITCGLRAGLVRTDTDFHVMVDHGAEVIPSAATLIIPASHEYDEEVGVLDEPLARALDSVSARARIASICTGAFVLASAGLLDGLRATTHWKSAALFRQRYPGIHLDPNVLYVDQGRVLSSAGEASGIDLCLHMVRADHGAAVANDVARRTVVAPHREGGQAQFIPRAVPQTPDASTTGSARQWALDHLGEPITLQDLAAHTGVSTRTFTRRFRDEVGQSPLEWMTQERVGRARELLEDTDMSVEQIATQVGFGSSGSLRQHFSTSVGVSPRAYRYTFRGETSDDE